MTALRIRIAAVSLPAASFLAGCGVSSPTSPVGRDVAAARAVWQRAGLRSYVITSSLSCFCAPEYSAAMTVTVHNGVVTAITNTASGAPQPLNIRQPVDSIFANLARQAAESPALLSAQFDAAYGYPVHAMFGSLAADAGYSVSLSELRPLP
jgi:Family of unknown function (DUF6174)